MFQTCAITVHYEDKYRWKFTSEIIIAPRTNPEYFIRWSM